MAMTTCPHCGKPLRPGVRFCGNCGKAVDLTDTSPAQPAATPEVGSQAGMPIEAVMASTDEEYVPCPNCGKPVRKGAKFCNNCGNAMPSEVSSTPAPVTMMFSQEATAPSPALKIATPAAAAEMVEKRPTAARKRRSRLTIPLIIIGLLLACTAVVTGGYIYLVDPYNMFQEMPLAGVLSTTSVTEIAISTANPTQETPIILPSETLPPASTDTPAPTETPIPTATETLTPTATAPARVTLLSDGFDGSVEDFRKNWKIWQAEFSGKLPQWKATLGVVQLTADGDPGIAGMTSNVIIPNDPGVEITFNAQLYQKTSNQVLIFDWDPIDSPRGFLSVASGVIHLEITPKKLTFETPNGDIESCESPVVGTEGHDYRIVISEQGVSLYVDTDTEPACPNKSMGVAPGQGRITFTGVGYLTSVLVTAQAQ
jgi:uncharacterized Zn finger protein (UPF0148 family)